MNILMTSCGCSRLWASCKVGIREESGTSLYGGWAKKGEGLERSRREEQTAERREVLGLSSFLGNYNRATYRATAGPLLSLSLSLSLSISLSPYHPPLGRLAPTSLAFTERWFHFTVIVFTGRHASYKSL